MKNNFFKGPFDFDGDGELDPFELGMEYMIFDECTKDEDDDGFVDWDEEDDDWEKDDWDDDEADLYE